MTTTFPSNIECPTERAALHTLLYFELFSYPLTAEEVFQFCPEPCVTLAEVSEKLQNLVSQSIVFQNKNFFQTKNDPSWMFKRLEANERADQLLPRARRMAKLIGNFPFVRGVSVSGSLSKHSMHADSDIDFFVITEPGRLWVARTLLVLFKKVFLLNSHQYFCVNYFIDTEHLEIAEKNLFTATETVTLLPMYGSTYYRAFCRANAWAWDYYPNFPYRSAAAVPADSKARFKSVLENLFSGKIGSWLDEKAMRLTLSFWKRKFKHLDGETFEVALKSRRYVSKHHPQHFQQKVLKHFEARVKELESAAESAE